MSGEWPDRSGFDRTGPSQVTVRRVCPLQGRASTTSAPCIGLPCIRSASPLREALANSTGLLLLGAQCGDRCSLSCAHQDLVGHPTLPRFARYRSGRIPRKRDESRMDLAIEEVTDAQRNKESRLAATLGFLRCTLRGECSPTRQQTLAINDNPHLQTQGSAQQPEWTPQHCGVCSP